MEVIPTRWVTLHGIFLSRTLVYADFGMEPVGIRLHPEGVAALGRQVFPSPTVTGSRVIGLELTVDRWLPANVWRLTGVDEVLLYDSRQGRKGLEW